MLKNKRYKQKLRRMKNKNTLGRRDTKKENKKRK
jgi:hypothetical protein